MDLGDFWRGWGVGLRVGLAYLPRSIKTVLRKSERRVLVTVGHESLFTAWALLFCLSAGVLVLPPAVTPCYEGKAFPLRTMTMLFYLR